MKYPTHLLKLIDVLKKLPGVGNKSAERYAFNLLSWQTGHLNELAGIVQDLHDKIRPCEVCGCLMNEHICPFCAERRAQNGEMCIIASPRDAFAIEETREYKGLYHVLGGLLSPMDGFGPEQLDLAKLKKRIQTHNIKEVIIALDATIEGDTTSLHLKRELEDLQLPISRLAFGLPMGSSLDYVDGGTLTRAFLGRRNY